MPDPRNHPRFGCRHPLGEHSIGLPHLTKLTLACNEERRTRRGEEGVRDPRLVRMSECASERPRIGRLYLRHELIQPRAG